MMFSIAICDDEKQICTDLVTMIQQHKTSSDDLHIRTYSDGKGLVNDLLIGLWFDLVLLDIEMADVNGLSVSRTIRDELKNDLTQIVFISSKQQYAMELFEFRPMNFLIKPIQDTRLVPLLDKAWVLAQRNQQCFTFSQGGTTQRIPFGEILYFASSGKYVRIITSRETHEFRGKLSELLPELQGANFLQIHQSYVVNAIHIKKYNYKEMVLFSGDSLNISQPYRVAVRNQWLQMRQEKIT